jgi:hypothetical protein
MAGNDFRGSDGGEMTAGKRGNHALREAEPARVPAARRIRKFEP